MQFVVERGVGVGVRREGYRLRACDYPIWDCPIWHIDIDDILPRPAWIRAFSRDTKKQVFFVRILLCFRGKDLHDVLWPVPCSYLSVVLVSVMVTLAILSTDCDDSSFFITQVAVHISNCGF